MFIVALPNGIALTSKSIEGHADFRAVFPSIHYKIPVVAKPGDKVRVVGHPAVAEVPGFDQIHHAEDHQRLVRSDPKACGPGGVQVGEFAEPKVLEFREGRHDAGLCWRSSVCLHGRRNGASSTAPMPLPVRAPGLKA